MPEIKMPEHISSQHYLLPVQLADASPLDQQTLCGIDPKDQHSFMITRLDGYLLSTTRLPQPCRLGDICGDICLLIGQDSLFYSADQGFSFKEINIPLEAGERLSQVKIYRQEIIVLLSCMKKPPARDLEPRLLRLTLSGALIWQTRLPVVNEQHIRIISPGKSPEELPEKRECPPKYWVLTQALICGETLMATYADSATSGLGARYAVNLNNGELIWHSRSEPVCYACALSKDRFLLTVNGYGALDTYLFDPEKLISEHWSTSGPCFETRQGKLMSIQTSSEFNEHYLVELAPGGEIIKCSPPFPEGKGYTSTPIQLAGDKTFFWRDNYLWGWQPGQTLEQVMKLDTQCYLVKLFALSANSFAMIYRRESLEPANIHIFQV